MVAPLNSQWRVCPADSSVPTAAASTMATVYLPPLVRTDELAGVTVKVGVGATSEMDGVRGVSRLQRSKAYVLSSGLARVMFCRRPRM